MREIYDVEESREFAGWYGHNVCADCVNVTLRSKCVSRSAVTTA
jgi:hypothetical protein